MAHPRTADSVVRLLAGRAKDEMDIAFLENKAECEYLEFLPQVGGVDACAMLDRFLTPKVVAAAIDHFDETVRDHGRKFLRELAEDGDPFAQELLRKLG